MYTKRNSNDFVYIYRPIYAKNLLLSPEIRVSKGSTKIPGQKKNSNFNLVKSSSCYFSIQHTDDFSIYK